MTTPQEPKVSLTLAPLPTTRRGYGIQLNVIPKDNRLVYANGRLVVLRSLSNPSDCLLFSEHKANVTVAVALPLSDLGSIRRRRRQRADLVVPRPSSSSATYKTGQDHLRPRLGRVVHPPHLRRRWG